MSQDTTPPPFNPFTLPGMNDGVDFMKKLWGGASSSVPGLMVPTLSVEELDKKITDLRTVEGWLGTNLSLLRTTIQSLEVQRNTIVMLNSLGNLHASEPQAAPDSTAKEAAQPSPAVAHAAAWWNLLQEQFAKTASSAFHSAAASHEPSAQDTGSPQAGAQKAGAQEAGTQGAGSQRTAPTRQTSAKTAKTSTTKTPRKKRSS